MYDSREDTLKHIWTVRKQIFEFCRHLQFRAKKHDRSKLESPEKELFDKYTPLLKDVTYGSDKYKQYLEEMGVALQHHYENNSHHPEHYEWGVHEMSLLDIIEMFCDWKAASLRHADGDFQKSLEINRNRFEIEDQLYNIFENTRKILDW